MTDAEIEQARKSLEPPLEPLYVDSKADERSRAIFVQLQKSGVVTTDGIPNEELWEMFPYQGDGSLARPFLTVLEARAVQKPGQSIVIAGYATITAARKCPDSVEQAL